jgi:tetratricopeptide (TPR) repeat protein
VPGVNAAIKPARIRGLYAKPWLQYCALALSGLLVHLPSLQADFVWDDVYLARDNPFIKSPLLALEAFRHHLFLGSTSAYYRPVQNLSYLLDYYLWNTDAAGFHLSSVLLHVVAGLLLFPLLTVVFQATCGTSSGRNKFNPRAAAFIASAVWIVHPVHSAAVDYVSGRADSLAFGFAAAGWLLYVHATKAKSNASKFAWYCCAALAGMLALCSREIACVWLAIFLIYTISFARVESRRRKIATVGCALLLLGAYVGLRQLPVYPGTPPAVDNWPAPVRAMLMLRALGDYARLLVWPSNLHMERTVFDAETLRNHLSWRAGAGIEYLSLLGAAFALLLALGCARKGPGRRLRTFGAVWFFAGFLPVSNLVQLNATVAEHWLYLPSVGVLIFLVGCAVELPRASLKLLPVVSVFIVLGLGARSLVRSTDWHDELTFFTRTLAAGGRSGRVVVNLAQAYSNLGRYSKAEELCRRILAIAPHYGVARNNLAFALSRQGKTAEAAALFAQTMKEAPVYGATYPRTWLAARNLAELRHAGHDDAAAIAVLEQARHDYPDTWELVSLESELLRENGRTNDALGLVREFAKRNWWYQPARLAEGELYAGNGDAAHAEQALHFAAMLDVHDVQALNLLAQLYSSEHRWTEARRAQLRAIARQPDKPSEYVMLASILDEMGQKSEAELTLAKVTRMREMAQAVAN